MPKTSSRQLVVLVIAIIIMTMLGSLALPLTAQSTFATNTPAAPSTPAQDNNTADNASSFATNTPTFSQNGFATATPAPAGPTASLFNYSLVIWLEDAMLDFVSRRIEALNNGDDDAELALQLTLYELNRRFPDAPSNPQRRERLIETMLAAPRGTIDMQAIVRPYIQDALNRNTSRATFEVNGFDVETFDANLNNRGEIDRIVHISYTDDERGLLYEDYALALQTESGSFDFVPSTVDLFAVPFGSVQSIQLERFGDVNDDSLDEVVLRVDDGMVNDRLYILQVRNNTMIDLTTPDNPLRASEIVSWPVDSSADAAELVVLRQRRESALPDWPCVSQREVTWRYELNFYRPSTALNTDYEPVDSLGCTLLAEEPLFQKPTRDAITLIENALIEYSFDAPGANRALVTLAMLYVQSGRLDDARNTAQSVIPAGDTSSWEYQQGTALIEALGVSSNTALDVCEALARASEAPACDMNAVVGQMLEMLELSTGDDLIEQLEAAGLPVAESIDVSPVGRAERTLVNFALVDAGWWGFFAGRDGLYNVEPADPPPGFQEPIMPPASLQPPQAAYDALFINNSPETALTVLTTLERNNPTTPLAPDALYLRALSYDLVGERDPAREAYYQLWEAYPRTLWGQLAAAHLEQR